MQSKNSKIIQKCDDRWFENLQKSLQTKERTHLVMLVLLERDNFCVNSVISLTSYAVVCSNVVVHNSDHNCVMVAIVDYYTSIRVWWGFLTAHPDPNPTITLTHQRAASLGSLGWTMKWKKPQSTGKRSGKGFRKSCISSVTRNSPSALASPTEEVDRWNVWA